MQKLKNFLILVTLLGSSFLPAITYAQSPTELHAGYEKYWKEDITRLKKIKAEKDDHLAAQQVTQMKEVMLPQLEKLVRESQEWKKTHSQEEVKQEQEWSAANPLNKEAGSLQTEMMIQGSTRGGELANAWKDYMHTMTTTIKKSK